MKPLITAKSSKALKKTSTMTVLNLGSPAHPPSQNASPQWILLATPIATFLDKITVDTKETFWTI
jgi:hypothetical protein